MTAPAAAPAFAWYLQFAFVVPASVTVIGWLVANNQADRREKRKDIREAIADLRIKTDVVLTAASAYWLIEVGAKRDAAAASLKAGLKSLSRSARGLKMSGLEIETDSLLVAIRQSATGGPFEQKGRKRTAADKARMTDLIGDVDALIAHAEAAFYQQFSLRQRHWTRFLPAALFLAVTKDRV